VALNLTTRLEDQIKREEKARAWDESALHVSDLWYADEGCKRQLWLRLQNAEKRHPTMGELLMWRSGRRVQHDTAELLTKDFGPGSGWTLVEEVPCKIEEVTGFADMVLRCYTSPEVVVVEHKTQRGFAFSKMEGEGPRSQHVIQLRGYLMALNADYGILLYRDRDGSNRPLEYIVYRGDNDVKQALHQIRLVRDMAEPPQELDAVISTHKPKKGVEYELSQGELGDKTTYVQNPWQCEYCPYYKISCQGALGRWREGVV